MAEWAEQLNQFLGEKGMRQKLPVFDKMDEADIQQFQDGITKPTFKNIQAQIDLYPNLKANIMTSKKSIDSIMETVELRVHKAAAPKFIYRLKFSKVDYGIYAGGEFCTPNFYGENVTFVETSFSENIAHITEDDIAEDFTKVFKEHFDRK